MAAEEKTASWNDKGLSGGNGSFDKGGITLEGLDRFHLRHIPFCALCLLRFYKDRLERRKSAILRSNCRVDQHAEHFSRDGDYLFRGGTPTARSTRAIGLCCALREDSTLVATEWRRATPAACPRAGGVAARTRGQPDRMESIRDDEF